MHKFRARVNLQAVQAAIIPELVPGKLTIRQWLGLHEAYKNEDAALDIVDDITNEVLDRGYEIYVENQLYPYTVNAAIEALSLIVQWNFLRRDESQVSPKLQPGWTPSIEPKQPEIDNWALKHYIDGNGAITEHCQDTSIENKVEEQLEQTEVTPDVTKVESDHTGIVNRKTKPQLLSSSESISPTRSLNDKSKTITSFEKELSKHEKFKYFSGKIPRQDSVGSVRDQPNIHTKTQLQTAVSKFPRESIKSTVDGRELIFDDDGNVIGMSQLDPDQLPLNRVRVKYHVQECTIPKKLMKSPQTFKYAENKNYSKYIFRRNQHGKSQKKNIHFGAPEYVIQSNFLSLMDAIQLVPGVKIKDDKTTKYGTKIGQRTNYGLNSEDPSKLDSELTQTESSIWTLNKKPALSSDFYLPPIASYTSFHKSL
ncbi:hypothetical protein Ahia01_000207800 [Argonauta hians]